jgi:hypothetical protein
MFGNITELYSNNVTFKRYGSPYLGHSASGQPRPLPTHLSYKKLIVKDGKSGCRV